MTYYALNATGIHEINKVRFNTDEIFRRREGEPIVADFSMIATGARVEAGAQLRDTYVPMSHLKSRTNVEAWLKEMGMKIKDRWEPGSGFECNYPAVLYFYHPQKHIGMINWMPRVFECPGEKRREAKGFYPYRSLHTQELVSYLEIG